MSTETTCTPDAVRKILAENTGFEAHQLEDQTTLKDVGMSSLDICDLVFTLEDEFGVNLNEDDFTNDTTIGQVVELTIKAKEKP